MNAVKRWYGRVVMIMTLAMFGTGLSAMSAQAAPTADPGPPVKCALYNAIKPGTDPVVGNIRGLQGLVIPILIVLVVAVVIVAAIPKLRKNLLNAIIWTAVLALVGGTIVAAVASMVKSSC